MNAPTVSIITPFYNSVAFLRETVESVLAQTFDDWELFLVDDGSSDSSTAIARDFASRDPQRISYMRLDNRTHRGPNIPRQLALQRCRGKYAAPLDSDDVWLPQKLQEQVAILETFPEAAMVYGSSLYWHDWSPDDDQKNHTPALAPGDRLYAPPELARLNYLLGPWGAPCPSDLLIRRDKLIEVGGFQEDLAVCEDILFETKIWLNFPVYVSNQCWDKYRRRPDSLWSQSQRSGAEAVARAEFLGWLGEYLQSREVRDAELLRLYRVAKRKYGNPRLFNFLQALRKPFRPLKHWLS